MEKLYQVAVVGGGPGGYVAAIRCAQLGLSTLCVDAWQDAEGKASLGGTCLNAGCIPSKALLESSENFERATHKFAEHGVRIKGVSLDLATMMARKQKIVSGLTGGIAVLLRKHDVTFLHGRAALLGNKGVWQIEVQTSDGVRVITAEHVIIATGSVPANAPGIEVDHQRIVDSTDALAFEDVPPRLAVLGMGVIGLELGSLWRRLGSQVTLLKPRSGFLPNVDERIAREAQRVFAKQGLDMRMGLKISSVKANKKQVVLEYQDQDGAHKLIADKLIVAVGRSPNTVGLGADKVGLKLDAKGYIEVDGACRTNLPKIYAIGDVVRGAMLAHKASEEGVAVAERIAGQAGHVNYQTIPWVIYTNPEIAWVGQTEQALREGGINYNVGQFPFSANGRAHGLGETEGLVKIIAQRDSDRILGIHIFGPYASEMIAEAVVAMEFGASAEDLARIVHAHPTLSEATHEAALAVAKRAIHS